MRPRDARDRSDPQPDRDVEPVCWLPVATPQGTTGTGEQRAIWDHFQTDGVAAFAGSYARLAHLARRLPRGSRVLDVGIGNGMFEEEALSRGHEVWCVDPSAEAIAAVRSRLGLGERAVVGFSQELPFPEAHFDAVVASEVLEHLDDNMLDRSVREFRRVLRPGGRLLATVPRGEDLSRALVVCPCCGEHFHRWGHQQSFDETSLRRRLEPQFEVELVQRRRFPTFSALNAKGKGIAVAQLALSRLGIPGASEKLLAVAVRR